MTADATDASALIWHAAWGSHRGNFRKNNEDFVVAGPVGATPPADSGVTMARGGCGLPGLVAVVCDGVGGGVAGEIASAEAARVFLDTLASGETAASDSDITARMRQAVETAQAHLLARAEADRSLEGFGTTLTVLIIMGRRGYSLQVGDSRLYRRRRWRLEQLSRDQSFVGTLRQTGRITEDEARHHPLRNMIDQVVGGSGRGVQPAFGNFDVERGDEFVLCSDGLSDALRDSDILRVLVDAADLTVQESVSRLMNTALDQSGRDNISVAVVRVGGESVGRLAGLVTRAMFAWEKWRTPAAACSREVPAVSAPVASDREQSPTDGEGRP